MHFTIFGLKYSRNLNLTIVYSSLPVLKKAIYAYYLPVLKKAIIC